MALKANSSRTSKGISVLRFVLNIAVIVSATFKVSVTSQYTICRHALMHVCTGIPLSNLPLILLHQGLGKFQPDGTIRPLGRISPAKLFGQDWPRQLQAGLEVQ